MVNKEQQILTDLELLQSSALFDAEYYLAQNPDVQAAGVDPYAHYLAHGAAEGRAPSAVFSTIDYVQSYPDVALSGINPLLHYLRYGQVVGREVLQRFAGWQKPVQGPVILLAGHAAGLTLFGGERSLLDVLKGLDQLEFRVVVTLPEATNSDYIASLRPYCLEVVVFPYSWWQMQRPIDQTALDNFKQLIQQHQVALVHANTLVHYEVMLAAQELGIKVAVHVRELPALDPALCELLAATPDQVLAHVQKHADLLISNSAFTASQYEGCKLQAIVRNTLNIEDFNLPPPAFTSPFKIALISSNSAKKGLSDFVHLSNWFAERQLPVQCLLIGPDNAEKQKLQHLQQQGLLPDNLELAEYCQEPQQALLQADIVVNLSNFQESFGRSVLEAMAAGRVVLAYRWGALPELIQHGQTGFLLPLHDIEGVGLQVLQLLKEPARLPKIVEAAHDYVQQHFSSQSFCSQLTAAYRLLDI